MSSNESKPDSRPPEFSDFGATLSGQPDRSPLLTRLRFAAELLADAGGYPDKPFLGFRQKDRSVKTVTIGASLIVGRQPGCDLVIADDPKLGRRQLRIVAADHLHFVEDLGAVNGTYVNDSTERVQRRELRDGDLILAGSQVFLFVNPTGAPSFEPEARP